ncbi:Mut7-C RNAse domain-containing protein [Candidatus Omnitrophota bacterium]
MKFILTKELGRLVRWLRLFGYDTLYFDSDDMNGLFVIAFNESRIIVTKRKTMPPSQNVEIVHVKSDLLKKQFNELKKKLRLALGGKGFFTRCADCNKEVFRIKKSSVKSLVPPYVFKTQKNFFQCPGCAKIFWKATHWTRAKEHMNEVCS